MLFNAGSSEQHWVSLVQLSITLTILQPLNLPSCPSWIPHSLVRFLCLLWHSQLGGRFYAIWPGSHCEPAFSTSFLTFYLFKFSASFLHSRTPPSIPCRVPVFLSPFAPNERKVKCPAMTAEPRGVLSPPHGTDGLLKGSNCPKSCRTQLTDPRGIHSAVHPIGTEALYHILGIVPYGT